MNLRSVVAASALFAALAVPASAKEWTDVTIALEGAYAPWNLTDANGKIVGFEPDLTEYLCAHAKLKCTLISQDWDGMITALNAGKLDVIMDALSITPERKEVIEYYAEKMGISHPIFTAIEAVSSIILWQFFFDIMQQTVQHCRISLR